uniref:Kinase n=1 Tax=Solanum tuberosum TaxID=4113 RepID=M1A0U8_SOLTU
MVADDLSDSRLSSVLDGARLAYTDGVLHEAALVVAQEAHQRSIPIVIDAERKIEGLDELLHLATYIVCSTRFPQASYLLQ